MKFHLELEERQVQAALTLIALGANGLLEELNEQLRAGPVAEKQAVQPPKPNGEDEVKGGEQP